MKNFKYIAFSFLLTGSAVLTGCLDEEPLYSQNNLVIFSSESNARQALLGCYGYMAAPTDMVSNGRNCLSALLALLGQTVIPVKTLMSV